MHKNKFSNDQFDEFHLSNFPPSDNIKKELEASYSEGLTIYEEKNHVIVEAAFPGLSSSDIEVLHDHGYLILNGKKQKEKISSDRTYHRIASESFFYRIKLPKSANENKEPVTRFKDGIMRVTFSKKVKKK